MNSLEIRNQIIQVLKESDKPLSPNEIADKIEFEQSFFVLSAELNRLTLSGRITVTRQSLGGEAYTISV